MALSQRLLGLKATQLKHLALLMGLASTGTKGELAPLIHSRLLAPSPLGNGDRVVSIDMGIRNLGICVLEKARLAAADNSETSSSGRADSPVRVVDWKRMDVLKRLDLNLHDEPTDDATDMETKSSSIRSKVNPALFSPLRLSPLAVQLATEIVHQYHPQHILIERQRFRSGGASAVQEWTLRVNLLEGMLWAIFALLRSQDAEGGSFSSTYEVSPARVASFWCARPAGFQTRVPKDLFADEGVSETTAAVQRTTVKERRRKVEKKEKVALVRSWLSGDDLKSETSVSLELSKEAREVADAFLPNSGRRKVKSGSMSNGARTNAGIGKLDDLADCLSQGVAWLRWMENEQHIRHILQEEINMDEVWLACSNV